MSLTLDYVGGRIPVAKIKESPQMVYYALKKDNSCKDKFEFPEVDKQGYGKLINIPVFTTARKRLSNRDIVYICSKNGGGKSYYVGEYVLSYHQMYPNDRIILLTRLDSDDTFKNLKVDKYMIHLKIHDEMLLDKFELSDFQNSLVIMDDIDSSDNCLELRKYLHRLRDDLIMNGRHYNINMLITSHDITNYRDTRTVLNECSALVLFPNMNIPYQIRRVLKIYIGMNDKQIAEIFKLDTRWVCFNMKYQFISYQHGIFMMNK
jgi:hypothetical protein